MGVYRRKRKDGSIAYYIDFYANGKRRRQLGGTTRTQAQRALERVRSDILQGKYDLVSMARDPLIEDFADAYLSRRQHLRSRRRDALSARHILNFFRGNRLSGIEPPHIEDYIIWRRKSGVANATINRELACFKRMYNLARKWGEARANPVQEVGLLPEPPGRTRFLSVDEARLLIACCHENLKPIVIMALNTGMRLGEILGLTWDRVFIDDVIDIPYVQLTNTKNNKQRFVPLNDDAVEVLRKLAKKNPGVEHVFISIHGKPLKSVKTPFQRAMQRAGIENFRFHDCRHTFASWFVMNGGDLLTLKEILGHSSLQMAQRYAHLAAKYKRSQVNNLTGLFIQQGQSADDSVENRIRG